MTTEEIERILQTVAENQLAHDEMHYRHSAHMAEMERMQAKHSADIAEIDRMLSASLQSQNRYDERLAIVSEIMHDLADKQLKNEERFAETDKRFAELAAAQIRYLARQEQLEASYQLFEQFVRDFRAETIQRLDGQDKANVHTESWFDALIDAQIQLTHRVDTLTGDIAAVNGRFERMAERVEAHDRQFDRIGEQLGQVVAAINALAAAQVRTDDQIRSLLDRNGSAATPKAKSKKAKKSSAKKAVKTVRKRGDR